MSLDPKAMEVVAEVLGKIKKELLTRIDAEGGEREIVLGMVADLDAKLVTYQSDAENNLADLMVSTEALRRSADDTKSVLCGLVDKDSLEASLTAINGVVASLGKSQSVTLSQLEKFGEKHKSSRKHIAQNQTDIKEQGAAIANLGDLVDNAATKEEVRDLEAKLDTTSGSVNAAVIDLAERANGLSEQQATTQDEVSNLHGTLTDQGTQIETLSKGADNAATKEEVADLDAKVLAHAEVVGDSLKEIDEAYVHLAATQEDTQQELAAQDKTITTLATGAANSASKATVAKIERELGENTEILDASVKELSEKSDALSEQQALTKADVASQQDDIREHGSAITTLIKDGKDTAKKDEVEDLQKRVSDSHTRLEGESAERRILEERQEVAENTLKVIHGTLDDHQGELVRLVERLPDMAAKDAVSALETQLSSLGESLTKSTLDLTEKWTDIEADITSLGNMLASQKADSNTTTQGLNEQISGLTQAASTLHKTVDEQTQGIYTKLEDTRESLLSKLESEKTTLAVMVEANQVLFATELADISAEHKGQIGDVMKLISGFTGEVDSLAKMIIDIGSDSIIFKAQPVVWRTGGPGYQRAAYVQNHGGTWQALVDTSEEPTCESKDWFLMQDGLKSTSRGLTEDKQFLRVTIDYASGRKDIHDIPAGHLVSKGLWSQDVTYSLFDTVMKDGNGYVAAKDDPQGEPGPSEDWLCYVLRGRPGRKGQKGDQGERGFIGPIGPVGPTGPMTPVNKILEGLFDFLHKADGTPIMAWKGPWKYQARYSRGDVIRFDGGLFLCTDDIDRSDISPLTAGATGWHVMFTAGEGGGGTLIPASVASPFNVVNFNRAIPRTGAGAGDTYFSLDDRLLRIWDVANNQWVIPNAVVNTFATDVLAKTGLGVIGEMRWSLASDTMFIWEGSQWTKASSGITHVADAAARISYTSGYIGELVVQEDDGSLWHWTSPPGGATQWIPVMPRPADNAILRSLVWDPTDPNIVHWRDERDALLTVVDNAAMFAIPIPHLQTGKLVYNQTAGKLYEFIAAPTTLTRTINDWKEAGGGSGGVQVYNRTADLPQNTPAGIPMPPYSLGYVRFHADATTPLGEIFIAVPGATPPAVNWRQISSSVFKKATLAGADVPDPQPNDIQITTEAGHKEVKIYDGGTNAWVTIYSEDQIQSWIAAGNLFTGTAEETGHGTAGAIDVVNMPAETALGPTDKGHYWVWVGTAGHALVTNDIGGAASAIDGQVLNVGDWIQVSEPTSGNYQYSVIPGDLLSKATADSLFGLNTWVQGAAQSGTLVSHNGSIYKASAAILATDLAPDDATNTKWVKVNISAGVHNVPADNNLPPTAPTGEVYLVVNSARNNGAPSFYIYDTPSAQWLNIGGGGGGGGATGQPMNLMGGELLYNTGTPIGSITMWPVDVPPDGWLICNGNAFDGVRYPILMRVLGGDNHTPDLQGQFIRGATGALDNFAKHQWTTGMPRNPLTTSSSGDHQHDYWDTLDSSGQGIHHAARASGESYIAPSQKPTWPDGDHSHTISGGDSESAPDHVVLHYIIKAEDMGLEKRII